ncbi:H-NS histone family protein [Roseateles albus]|uniref:H-NS histone family protein n=1 Tax=Roseateles albus TaxID=2987525 RepID=A0ABT5KBP3_9BURK|nr:H-NS histone family protein [Roseateles albus]MDC8770989.1 H-NS histone family protein [Roseateles albus]
MSTLKELIAARAALDAEIAKTQDAERSAAIAQVKALMADFDLSISDLSGRAPKAAKAAGGKAVAAKYVDKATGESWSGRGLKPRWLKAKLDAGAKIEDFAV